MRYGDVKNIEGKEASQVKEYPTIKRGIGIVCHGDCLINRDGRLIWIYAMEKDQFLDAKSAEQGNVRKRLLCFLGPLSSELTSELDKC